MRLWEDVRDKGEGRMTEVELRGIVLKHGRIPLELWDSIPEGIWKTLEGWEEKDWWEYGVSLRAGWLTEKGKKALESCPA